MTLLIFSHKNRTQTQKNSEKNSDGDRKFGDRYIAIWIQTIRNYLLKLFNFNKMNDMQNL